MRHILAHEVPEELLLECKMKLSEESFVNVFERTDWHIVYMFVETIVHPTGFKLPTGATEYPFFEFSKKHYVPLVLYNNSRNLFFVGGRSHADVSSDLYEKLVIHNRPLLLMREYNTVRFTYI